MKIAKSIPAKLQGVLPPTVKLEYRISKFGRIEGVAGKARLVSDSVPGPVVKIEGGYDVAFVWLDMAWHAAARAAGYQV